MKLFPDPGPSNAATRHASKAAVTDRVQPKDPGATPKPGTTPRKSASVKGRTPSVGGGQGGVVAALDIGTTKIACLIARNDPGGLRVLGVGYHRADGVRAGQVANMGELELAIRAAVDGAERVAGTRIEDVVVSISGGRPCSTRLEVELAIDGRDVRPGDVNRIQAFARNQQIAQDRELICAETLSYAIDDADGILDPRGMFGHTLGVSMHLVSAQSGPLRNLAMVIERCHLNIARRVLTPYASALACLTEEERALGVTLVDLGGGVTSFAVFHEGRFVHTDSIPVGARHITSDISQGLTTPFGIAERLKTMHGSCLATPADSREMLRIPQIGDENETHVQDVPRSMLIQIIRPRIEEILELVRDRLEAGGLGEMGNNLAVLTGGGSQLEGIRDLAETVLERPVHLGHPPRIRGLAEGLRGPAFSTVIGLLHAATAKDPDPFDTTTFGAQDPQRGMFGRLSYWLREAF